MWRGLPRSDRLQIAGLAPAIFVFAPAWRIVLDLFQSVVYFPESTTFRGACREACGWGVADDFRAVRSEPGAGFIAARVHRRDREGDPDRSAVRDRNGRA